MSPDMQNLAPTIERQVAKRTWGRIKHLCVETIKERVIIHGCTTSYYFVQLAVSAVREVAPSAALELAIEVSNVGMEKGPGTGNRYVFGFNRSRTRAEHLADERFASVPR